MQIPVNFKVDISAFIECAGRYFSHYLVRYCNIYQYTIVLCNTRGVLLMSKKNKIKSTPKY
jgi:hypothetical protein